MKGRVCFLSTLLILLMCSGLFAQSTYSLSYDVLQTSNTSRTIDKDELGNVYIMDYTFCSAQSNTECISLTKFDKNGEMQWNQVYNLHPPYQYRGGGQGCLHVSDGEIVMVGDEELRPDYHRYFIAYWDMAGSLLDTFFYDFVPAVGNSFVRAIVKYNDTTYYAYGNEELAPTNNTLFLSKISRNGEELWRRHFGSGLDWLPSPESLRIYQDTLLLIGSTEKFGLGREALLICTDLEGNEKWLDFVEEEQRFNTPQLRLDTKNSSDIVYSFSHDSSALLHHNPFVTKINQNRDEQWIHEFPFAFSKRVNAIYLADNGDIIGVGATDGRRNGQIQGLGWVFRISATGVLKWEVEVYESRHMAGFNQAFLDVIEQDDGHIFIIGTITDTIGLGVPNANSWVVRLDSNGQCSGDNCPEIEVIYSATRSTAPRSLSNALVVYPNPATSDVYIGNMAMKTALVSLFDIQGKLVKAWRVDQVDANDKRLSLEFVNAGSYIIMTQDRRGRALGVGKLVVD